LKQSVAVEKLTWEKSSEKTSRQDALQTILSARLDIFYPQIFPRFLKSRFFNSHKPLHSVGKSFNVGRREKRIARGPLVPPLLQNPLLQGFPLDPVNFSVHYDLKYALQT
jgi:hypothetical protein